VDRLYEAIVLGEPKEAIGCVETNIGRDVRDRKRMGVFPWQGSRCVRLVPSVSKHANPSTQPAACRPLKHARLATCARQSMLAVDVS
jgi:23S rRNA-/tRNA-specific pseudouridylate synthase